MTEVKHRPLRIVLGWGTKIVHHMSSDPNGFGICYILNVCVCCPVISAL